VEKRLVVEVALMTNGIQVTRGTRDAKLLARGFVTCVAVASFSQLGATSLARLYGGLNHMWLGSAHL
jgi:hypothetical protein